MALDLSTISWAVGLGIGTFFSPCGWALIPAYVGYFAGTPEGEDPGTWLQQALRGARFGLAAAVGSLLVLAAAAGLVSLVLRQVGVTSQLLGSTSVALGVVVGVLVFALGVLMLTDRAPALSLPLRAPQQKTLAGMVAFGVLFALGSIGCTLPVFIGFTTAVLVTAASPLSGLVALLVFGVTIAVLLVVTSILVAVAKEQVQERVRRAMPFVKPASGVLLMAAGVYILWYYLYSLPA